MRFDPCRRAAFVPVVPDANTNAILSLQNKGFRNLVRCDGEPALLRLRFSLRGESFARPQSSSATAMLRAAISRPKRQLCSLIVLRIFFAGAAARFGANRAREVKPADRLPVQRSAHQNGANGKQFGQTKACEESSITVACYLCNTLPKTACQPVLGAVPLLRVQMPSVIVMLRRRGASRGRPVIGGSLKSLAFMRECPKARSG
jgi:hypothetical protein